MIAWLPPLVFGAALLIGVLGGAAQAGSGEGQSPASAGAAMPPSEPPSAGAAAATEPEADSTASDQPAAQTPPPQKLLCMWRNKGVTGFCDVAPETPVGASCSCRSIIEHKAKKFSGKVIVSR